MLMLLLDLIDKYSLFNIDRKEYSSSSRSMVEEDGESNYPKKRGGESLQSKKKMNSTGFIEDLDSMLICAVTM